MGAIPTLGFGPETPRTEQPPDVELRLSKKIDKEIAAFGIGGARYGFGEEMGRALLYGDAVGAARVWVAQGLEIDTRVVGLRFRGQSRLQPAPASAPRVQPLRAKHRLRSDDDQRRGESGSA